MAKKQTILLTILGALVIVMISAYLVWFAPKDFQAENQTLFAVERDDTIADIVANLSDQGFIRSTFGTQVAFKLNRTGVVQFGTYNVSPRMDAWQIAYIIVHNQTATARVTIPEGYTTNQIAELLEKKNIIMATDFLKAADNFPPDFTFLTSRPDNSLEGYLFPDTYNMNQGTPVRDLLVQLLDNFKQRIATVDTQLKSSKYTLHQIVTLASLIEKEARTDPSRKMVAGILINRLKKGMRLDVDATVRYITENWTRPITQADLNINSPYNTRKVAGLPPGPICNPGLASIQAVLSPAASDYLYYLTDPEGVIYYAKTLDEHNANKAKYLQ
ncbi:hypothetical protein A3K24_01825 [candidate division Kazan bacterium RIFCSPHIGHO2_01_FULL_44_14]|uniref:Endolytic murein transglycosylase n=1 Tax=candidate division Kazan bacterium RIFCSPLOWO2_01_FULL_45_19 TaxID=1798538 RepID=A0A1F4NQL4_UNCK3|nr:hypothetical protein [uncultured bacterium]OGB73567.1 MAG: hypothetical protein A3K51_01825 [candidate division Kazan bacterium RIFCSPLOWO2_01_FULL_45_19]OGB77812.1 MAG: hypothetical protein A3K24_01825 [candidate division Kazan bacterium RIFCSPHIGHO2_01_FULL_44_14]